MENNNNQGRKISESSIFKNFMNKAEEYLKKPSRLKDLMNDAFKKASDKKDIGTIAHDVWESIQTLSRMIKAAATGEYTGIPTSTVVGGIAVLLYFISPIDFVPDFIPVIGLLDDVALLAWFMTSIKSEMNKFLEWEKGNHAATAGAGASMSRSSTAAYNHSTPVATPTYPDISHQGIADPKDELLVKDFNAHDQSPAPDTNSNRSGTGFGEPNTTDGTRIPNSNNTGGDPGGNVH
jgi:uncharacterized membrane protein YkvA (DUF1232 family)